MRGKKTEIRNPPKKSRSLKGQNKDLKRISKNNFSVYSSLRSRPLDKDKAFLTPRGIEELKQTNKALDKGLGKPARSAKVQNKISKKMKEKRNPISKILNIWD